MNFGSCKPRFVEGAISDIFMNTRFNKINGSYSWEDGSEIKHEEWNNGEGFHPMQPQVPKLVVLQLVFSLWIYIQYILFILTRLYLREIQLYDDYVESCGISNGPMGHNCFY